jgi:hypothetical protein
MQGRTFDASEMLRRESKLTSSFSLDILWNFQLVPTGVSNYNRPRWESATEFCAALDRYGERATKIKRENH